MKKQLIFPLILISAALVGCAGGKRIEMQPETRKIIKTVAIEQDISIPKKLYFTSKTQAIADNFGLIGMLVGDSEKANSRRELESAMVAGNVSVPTLVRSAFRREMAKRTPFKPLKSGASADANLTMKVHLYGFESLGAGNRFYPDLTVSAEMKDNSGKIIWRGRGVVSPLSKQNTASYTYKQMLAKPARIQEMLATAARLAAREALADL